MSSVQTEIAGLEERLRLAELGPDPKFFEEALADDAVIVVEDGQPSLPNRTSSQLISPERGQSSLVSR